MTFTGHRGNAPGHPLAPSKFPHYKCGHLREKCYTPGFRGHCRRTPKGEQAVQGECLGKKTRTYVSLILKAARDECGDLMGEGIDRENKTKQNQTQEGTFQSAGSKPKFDLGGFTQIRHPLNCPL